MNIHCFQHVPFEGLGCIENWIKKGNHHLMYTKFYENAFLPDLNTIDFLIVMGGPMGVYDEAEFPWLKTEKEFIKKVIEAGKIVLGVCLGAQLIASAMGAKVYPNKQKEIGWFPVNFNPSFQTYTSININTEFNVFHWHGDTFDLPNGANLHSSSSVCQNQLFTLGEKVMGIQYHLEATSDSMKAFVTNCGHELVSGKEFIQSEQQILATTKFIQATNKMMEDILDRLAKKENADDAENRDKI